MSYLYTLSQQKDTYQYIDLIFEGLDDEALGELFSGYEKDVDSMIDIILNEAFAVLHSKEGKIKNSSFGYLDKLTEGIETSLRRSSFNYFVSSTLPDFEMNWHHIEWGNLIQMYKYLCVLAARDHCFGKDTEVRMFDGSVKKIQDIQVGDLVMGPDSKSRTVLRTHSGIDDLYQINFVKNQQPQITNGLHDLVLYQKTKEGRKQRRVKVQEAFKKSRWWYQNNPQKMVGFNLPHRSVKIDPYYLGLWLGDGTAMNQRITTFDEEVVSWLKGYAERRGEEFLYKDGNVKIGFSLRGKRSHQKGLIYELRKLGVLENKHIPQSYLNNEWEVRLRLLAGLIDSDGWLKDGMFYFSQSNKDFCLQVIELAQSLGFKTSLLENNQKSNVLKGKYQSWVVSIFGEIEKIPTLIKRKRYQRTGRAKVYDRSLLGIKNIEKVGKGQYYGFECNKDHLFLLKDGSIVSNSKSYTFSFAYPLWKMYRYLRSKTGYVQKEYQLSSFGMIVTSGMTLGRHLLSLIKAEIEDNEILSRELYKTGNREGWGKEYIRCKNGAELIVRGYESRIRGYHPTWLVVDDLLTDQALYSQEQRDKYINMFHSVLMNAIVPGGQVLVCGTPFHELDLYADLKKRKGWRTFEYPAIFPDGRLLWGNRYNYNAIMAKKENQGSIIFSREILVKPVSSASTIFPYKIIEKSFIGMDDYTIVDNIYSHKRKFKRVVTGCDFARSANVGADYSVFITIGVDDLDNYWLLNVWREKGKSYNEQIANLKRIYSEFLPEVVMMEVNQMQQLFSDGGKEAGLPVVDHHTGTNKYNLESGLPGMSVLFEQGRIKLPRGDIRSKNITDSLAMELSSVTWTEKGKLEGVGAHDDQVMALWISLLAAQYVNENFSFSFL